MHFITSMHPFNTAYTRIAPNYPRGKLLSSIVASRSVPILEPSHKCRITQLFINSARYIECMFIRLLERSRSGSSFSPKLNTQWSSLIFRHHDI